MDDLVEWLGDFPDFLDAELVALRLFGRNVEELLGSHREVTNRAFSHDRGLGDHVDAGLEVSERFALAVLTLVSGANTDDSAFLDEQLHRVRLGQQVDAHLLGLFGEETRQLSHRGDVVAVVVEVRRRRYQFDLALLGQQVRRVLVDFAVNRPFRRIEIREQFLHRAWAHVRAGQRVGSADLALFDHCDRYFAERFEQFRVLLEDLHDLDGGSEAGGSTADDADSNFDAFVLGVGRSTDEFRHLIYRWRKIGRLNAVTRHTLTRPSWP